MLDEQAEIGGGIGQSGLLRGGAGGYNLSMEPCGAVDGKEKSTGVPGRRLALALLLPVAAWEIPWIALRSWMPAWVAAASAAAFAALLVRLAFRRRDRFPAGAAALVGAALLGVLLEPVPAAGPWIPAHARMPRIALEGDRVRIEDLRDFRWRSETDHDAAWRTEEYDLGALDRCWLGVVPLGEDGLIAHTLLLFSFRDGKALALSVEARRRPGQTYGPVRGILRTYPLLYVLGDPRDVLGLRARAWGDRIDLLPVRPDRERMRTVLRDALLRAGDLAEGGAFYNSLVDNCTTTLARHASRSVDLGWSLRRILNGKVGEYAHANGLLDTDLPWEAVKDRFRSDGRIRTADEGDLAAWMRAATSGGL